MCIWGSIAYVKYHGNSLNYVSQAGEQMAAKATPEQVAEFITTIGFGQYAKFFLDDEMDGEMMLDAKDSDLPDQVDSRLHRVKIIALFRSTFAGTKKTRLLKFCD